MTSDAGGQPEGPGTAPGGELVRLEVDPVAHRRKVRRQLLALLGFGVLALVCIAGIVTGEVTRRLFMIALLGVVGVVGAGGALVALVRLRGERRTGDDAIDLAVTDSTLVGPGGLAIPWQEIAGVEMSRVPAPAQLEAADTGGKGLVRSSAVVRLMLTDPRSTLERTTTPRQAASVRTGEGAPHVRIELDDREPGELARLREVLDAELAPRGQRVRDIAD